MYPRYPTPPDHTTGPVYPRYTTPPDYTTGPVYPRYPTPPDYITRVENDRLSRVGGGGAGVGAAGQCRCAPVYAPVCGNNAQTYPNACTAACAYGRFVSCGASFCTLCSVVEGQKGCV